MLGEDKKEDQTWDVRLLSHKTCVKHIRDPVSGCVLGTKLGKRTQR